MAEPLNAIPMNEIDIKDDDKLRYIQRVLESDAPRQDRDAAAAMVREIRTRIRRVYATRNAGVALPQALQEWSDPEKEPRFQPGEET